MKTATLIKEQDSGSGAHQGVYQLSEPLEGASVVVVSAVHALFSGPETYIFAADQDGKILSYTELEGSYRGGLSHVEALKGAGYTVVDAAADADEPSTRGSLIIMGEWVD